MGIELRCLFGQVAAFVHAAAFPALFGGVVAPARCCGHGHHFTRTQRILVCTQGAAGYLIPDGVQCLERALELRARAEQVFVQRVDFGLDAFDQGVSCAWLRGVLSIKPQALETLQAIV